MVFTFLFAVQASSAQDNRGKYERARILFEGQDTPTDLLVQIRDGKVFIGEDIVLFTEEAYELKKLEKGGIIPFSSWGWPGGIIHYVVPSGLGSAAIVNNAIAHVNASTNICLVPRTTQSDYIVFQESDVACWSYVGKIGGAQPINVHSLCGFGAAVHEICHAAGMWHEQSRNDRDTYVTINTANIQSGYGSNFDKYGAWGTEAGAYDYGSIMHYGAFAFTANGMPTISIKSPPAAPGTSIGQRSGLSGGDVAALNTIYPTVACDKGGGSSGGGGSTGGGSTGGGGGGGGVVVVLAPALTMAEEISIDPEPLISDDGFSVRTNVTNTGNADFNGCLLMKLFTAGGQLLTQVSLDPPVTLQPGKTFENRQTLSSPGVSFATGEYRVELFYENSCGSSEQEIIATSSFPSKKAIRGIKIIPNLEVKPLQFAFEKEGGNGTLEITSNTVWNVKDAPEWLKFPEVRATGNRKLQFTCDSNITFVPRSAKFTVSATGTKTFEITASQKAIPLSECLAPSGLRSTATGYSWVRLSWNRLRGTDLYRLRYRVLNDTSWVYIDSLRTTTWDISSLNPCSEYLFQVASYCAGIQSVWSANFPITTGGCDDPYCYSYGTGKSDWIESVSLAGKVITTGQNLGYVNLTDTLVSLEEGRVQNFRFTSRHNSQSNTDLYRWRVYIDFNGDKDFQDTLEQIYNQVVPKLSSVVSIFKSLTIPENMPLGITRLRVMLSKDKANLDACEKGADVFEVEDYNVKIIKNKDSIFVVPDTVFMKSVYNTVRVNVRASTGWDVKQWPSWLNTSHPGWSATPFGLNTSIFANVNNGARRQFDFTYQLKGTVKTKIQFLSQDPFRPTCSVDTNTIVLTDQAQDGTIPVRSNLYWRATTQAFWIRILNPLGRDTGLVRYAVLANQTPFPRVDTIRIFAASGDTIGGLVLLRQAAVKPILRTDLDSLVFSAAGANRSLRISGNVGWKLVEKPSWLKVAKTQGPATDTLIVSVDAFADGQAREGKLVLQVPNDTIRVSIMVRQQAAAATLQLVTRMLGLPDTAGRFSVTLQANVPWQIRSKPDWVRQISPAVDSGYGRKDHLLSATFEANPTFVGRKGLIFWQGSGLTDSLELVQAPKQVVLPASWELRPTSRVHQVLIQQNADFRLGQLLKPVPGDLIGMFFEDGGILRCAGYLVWTGENATMKVFGDDPATTRVEGFSVGAPLRCRIRPLHTNQDIEVLLRFAPLGSFGVVTAGGTFQPDGVSALESLTSLSPSRMDIRLVSGWNTISGYILPEMLRFDYLTDWSARPTIVSIEDGDGGIYLPAKGNPAFPPYEVRRGYRVFTSGPATLTLTGSLVRPSLFPLSIRKGLQLIPFFSFQTRPVAEVMKPILDEIRFLKDNTGRAFIPDLGISTLKQLDPGQGYVLHARKEAVLSYPDTYVAGVPPPVVQQDVQQDTLTYYRLGGKINTGNHAIVVLRSNTLLLRPGDEIGLFASDTMLFGAARVDTGNLALTAWGNGSLVAPRNGFLDGEMMRLKLWRRSDNRVYPLLIQWEEGTEGRYRRDELFIGKILSLALTPTPFVEEDVASLGIYPNPAAEYCQILPALDFLSPVKVHLSDAGGKVVKSWVFPDGLRRDRPEELRWTDIPPGNYVLRLENSHKVVHKKLQILR